MYWFLFLSICIMGIGVVVSGLFARHRARHFDATTWHMSEAAAIIDALSQAVAKSEAEAAIKIVDDPPLEKTAAEILSRHGNIEGWSQATESSLMLDYIDAACKGNRDGVSLVDFDNYLVGKGS